MPRAKKKQPENYIEVTLQEVVIAKNALLSLLGNRSIPVDIGMDVAIAWKSLQEHYDYIEQVKRVKLAATLKDDEDGIEDDDPRYKEFEKEFREFLEDEVVKIKIRNKINLNDDRMKTVTTQPINVHNILPFLTGV